MRTLRDMTAEDWRILELDIKREQDIQHAQKQLAWWLRRVSEELPLVQMSVKQRNAYYRGLARR